MINPLLYSTDYSIVWENTLPPEKRNPSNIAWGAVIMKAIQWLHDLFFVKYADEFSGASWNNFTAYAAGERVKYSDHSVYEAQAAILIGQPAPNVNSDWLKVQNNWIGARERAKYNGQKMVLEYALNKWFDTDFRYAPFVSDIYIQNNVIDSGGYDIAESDNLSSSIPVNEIFADDSIGNIYSSNQNGFTIFVPLAVYGALSPDPPSREKIVRAFADMYVTAGVTYDVQTY